MTGELWVIELEIELVDEYGLSLELELSTWELICETPDAHVAWIKMCFTDNTFEESLCEGAVFLFLLVSFGSD